MLADLAHADRRRSPRPSERWRWPPSTAPGAGGRRPSALAARPELDPPRFCAACGRRLTVRVSLAGGGPAAGAAGPRPRSPLSSRSSAAWRTCQSRSVAGRGPGRRRPRRPRTGRGRGRPAGALWPCPAVAARIAASPASSPIGTERRDRRLPHRARPSWPVASAASTGHHPRLRRRALTARPGRHLDDGRVGLGQQRDQGDRTVAGAGRRRLARPAPHDGRRSASAACRSASRERAEPLERAEGGGPHDRVVVGQRGAGGGLVPLVPGTARRRAAAPHDGARVTRGPRPRAQRPRRGRSAPRSRAASRAARAATTTSPARQPRGPSAASGRRLRSSGTDGAAPQSIASGREGSRDRGPCPERGRLRRRP